VRPVFPNAQYIVQRGEYEQAMRPNERTRATYFPINYAPLVASGQMLLQDADTVDVVAGVQTVVTAGHTPRHTSVMFTSQGQSGLFVADLAMYTAHFERLGWMSAYDIEPIVTLESKRYWQQWALDHEALLIFQHDPKTLTGKLVAEGEKRVVETVLRQPESLTQG
jgi:glyoxylase-like metal-dependent hydrolase (beta-lactamase superfamily II)